MFVQERQARIVEQLEAHPKYSMEQLQLAMGVSRSTLRRDLLELERQGQVVRVHGGVMHPQYLHGESTFGRRSGEQTQAKRRIAQCAAELVPANASVFLDAGTTCLEIGHHLLVRNDLKLLTHSIPLVAEAMEVAEGATVVCLGGELRAVSGALVGEITDGWHQRLWGDVAFIAASGLDPRDGASTTDLHEATVKRHMIQRSRRRVLVCDLTKCGKPAAVQFAAWNELDDWVVDDVPPEPFNGVVKLHMTSECL